MSITIPHTVSEFKDFLRNTEGEVKLRVWTGTGYLIGSLERYTATEFVLSYTQNGRGRVRTFQIAHVSELSPVLIQP